jgi:hypothetical protein
MNCYVNVMTSSRYRAMCLLFAALLIESPADDASAQPADAPASFCFKFITTRKTAQLEGAILLNQCTGQTWLLTRTARQGGASGYRWNLLVADGLEINKPSPRPEVRIPVPVRPNAEMPAPMHPRTEKCFTFQGRQFCE